MLSAATVSQHNFLDGVFFSLGHSPTDRLAVLVSVVECHVHLALPVLLSSNPVLKNMWPEGKLSITEVTKRPLTAATLFKNSMIALVDNLASKVTIFFSAYPFYGPFRWSPALLAVTGSLLIYVVENVMCDLPFR